MNRDELMNLFDPMQEAELECDGFSRVVASVLIEQGHKPTLMAGTLSVRDRRVQPHFWVNIDGWTIDYQIRRWLGNEPWIPHGVFRQSDTEAMYVGVEVAAHVIPAGLRSLMLMSSKDLMSQPQA
ncbi:hypothetical protein [Pseudomonas mosselii]|uniref:hypothetical protein n=1 Tax=Pseudomonas mosselii TaxID=78327 RepID=UPI0021D808A1|nr:hypothetical protein [Pseudomonas mosselii]MCU9528076.1 hypothetical protein [Pseudomonas mosselii]MCU9535185.1 hypothetical protein [Pseudomonas mosselii]MCU9542704.1 hypothetical protein [Pseudomonas mosselii]MCU9546920.1 hypothetical protein [Pseudomonas mosselii]